jgi:hypothetical protein
MDYWIAVAGGLTVVVTALAAFWRWAWPFLRRVGHFLDDWFGEPARPGFPGQSGVMERLARVEHEVHTNSGSSMRDAVNRIEDTLRQTAADLKDTQVAAIERQAAAKAEQQTMWSAIEAIAKSTPPEE